MSPFLIKIVFYVLLEEQKILEIGLTDANIIRVPMDLTGIEKG